MTLFSRDFNLIAIATALAGGLILFSGYSQADKQKKSHASESYAEAGVVAPADPDVQGEVRNNELKEAASNTKKTASDSVGMRGVESAITTSPMSGENDRVNDGEAASTKARVSHIASKAPAAPDIMVSQPNAPVPPPLGPFAKGGAIQAVAPHAPELAATYSSDSGVDNVKESQENPSKKTPANKQQTAPVLSMNMPAPPPPPDWDKVVKQPLNSPQQAQKQQQMIEVPPRPRMQAPQALNVPQIAAPARIGMPSMPEFDMQRPSQIQMPEFNMNAPQQRQAPQWVPPTLPYIYVPIPRASLPFHGGQQRQQVPGEVLMQPVPPGFIPQQPPYPMVNSGK